jgi:hypothetical protein
MLRGDKRLAEHIDRQPVSSPADRLRLLPFEFFVA